MYVVSMFASALALGGMLFFTIVVTPLVFTRLPTDTAGRFIRDVFPWYYLYVIATTGIAALAFVTGNLAAALLMGLVCALGVYARQWLMPRIHQLRDAAKAGDTVAERRFDRRHRLSVLINLLQLLTVAGVLIHGLL